MNNNDVEKRIVLILGLMHSGTTIVWRAFRKDDRFLCFDEPYSGLDVLPRQNTRRSYGEFIKLLSSSPKHFWKKYAPFHPLEELNDEFTLQQQEYLKFLLAQDRFIVIDETHLHLHIRALSKVIPNAHVIHLYRRASSFATSHLRPPAMLNNTTLPRRIFRLMRHEYNKSVFWSRKDFIPGLRRDEVIGSHPDSKFGLMLSDAGYNTEQIMNSSTLIRLLAYWHYHYHHISRDGPQFYGENFKSLSYENFATRPHEIMTDMYQWLGLKESENITYTNVHPPKSPYKTNDNRWCEAARIAGFSELEIDTLL